MKFDKDYPNECFYVFSEIVLITNDFDRHYSSIHSVPLNRTKTDSLVPCLSAPCRYYIYMTSTTLPHQFIQIRRTLHVKFTLLILQGWHQRRVIDPFHRFFDGTACVLHHIFDQLAQDMVGQVSRYLLMGGLVHRVSTFVLWRKRSACSVPK